MNQTADIAADLLRDPPDELRELMADSRTSDAAREAVASLVLPPSASNGLGSSNGTSLTGDGRLQVVNEHQELT